MSRVSDFICNAQCCFHSGCDKCCGSCTKQSVQSAVTAQRRAERDLVGNGVTSLETRVQCSGLQSQFVTHAGCTTLCIGFVHNTCVVTSPPCSTPCCDLRLIGTTTLGDLGPMSGASNSICCALRAEVGSSGTLSWSLSGRRDPDA